MAREKLDIVYPMAGVSETYAFSDQPPNTSRDERNMRCFDPITGRMRGSQRAGLGIYSGNAPANNFAKISDIAYVQREINPYNWTANTGNLNDGKVAFTTSREGDNVIGDAWTGAIDEPSNLIDLQRDTFNSFWALSDGGVVLCINSDAGIGKTIETQVDTDTPHLARRLAVDNFGNFFVASGHDASHVVADNDTAFIKGYELQEDGEYRLAYEIKPGFIPLDIKVYGEDLFVWGVYVGTLNTDCELRFRRYPQYRFDETPTVDDESSWTETFDQLPTALARVASDAYTGGMRVRNDGQVYVTFGVFNSSIEQTYGYVAKLKPISFTSNAETWEYAFTASSTIENGYGLDIDICEPKASDNRTILWMAGGKYSTQGEPHLVAIADNGGSLDWTNAAEVSFDDGAACRGWGVASAPNSQHLRIDSDEDGRVYVPYHGDDSSSSEDGYHLLIYTLDATGSSLTATQERRIKNYSTVAGDDHADLQNNLLNCVAVPLAYPDYNGADIPYAQYVFVGGPPNTTSDPNHSIAKAVLANGEADGGLPLRDIKRVAAAGGTWYEVTNSGFSKLRDPDGNDITYHTAANYLQSATFNGVIYYTDGDDYYYYSPKNSDVRPWRSKSIGEIPQRCRLVEVWRGRLVLARSDEVPGAWHMSRVGDPEDWNQFAQVQDAGMARSYTTSRMGECPDSINSIVPYRDDLLWLGCDSSIWQMTGDPGAGGTFDLISDEVGMSWGKPWCKDDLGNLWFFGSKGGLYTTAGGGLNEVSQGKLRKRLQSIDLRQYYVRLVYNFIDDGVHIFVMPFANPNAMVDHYFYDKRTNAFHIDRFGRPTETPCQPTAACVVDGDGPFDRAILIGCEDGRVRMWGRTTAGAVPLSDELTDSETVPIDSYVLIGPLAPVHADYEAVLSEMTVVLASSNDGCLYDLFSTETPDDLGSPDVSGKLHAGRNRAHLIRLAGDSLFLRMRNARDGKTWSFEKGQMMVSRGGQTRA